MIIYLIIINIIGFIICFIDKYKAKKQRYRISEKRLLIISLFGGCFGFFMGMIIFHHKTRKKVFYIFIPLMIIMWIFVLQLIKNVL